MGAKTYLTIALVVIVLIILLYFILDANISKDDAYKAKLREHLDTTEDPLKDKCKDECTSDDDTSVDCLTCKSSIPGGYKNYSDYFLTTTSPGGDDFLDTFCSVSDDSSTITCKGGNYDESSQTWGNKYRFQNDGTGAYMMQHIGKKVWCEYDKDSKIISCDKDDYHKTDKDGGRFQIVYSGEYMPTSCDDSDDDDCNDKLSFYDDRGHLTTLEVKPEGAVKSWWQNTWSGETDQDKKRDEIEKKTCRW